jgi:hypothetical protein
MADRAARLRDAIVQEHGGFPDSAASIREDRDARTIVVDASVAAKWYLKEPGSKEEAILTLTHAAGAQARRTTGGGLRCHIGSMDDVMK